MSHHTVLGGLLIKGDGREEREGWEGRQGTCFEGLLTFLLEECGRYIWLPTQYPSIFFP